MSYGLYILFHFKQLGDTDYYIGVLQRDYAGEFYERDLTGTPLTIAYGDGSADDYLQLIGAEATISFYADKSFEWRSLYTSDKRMYKVVVRKDNAENGAIVFQGWLSTQQYSEEIEYEPELEFTAIDGIGEFEGLDYVDNDGKEYSGIKSYKEILVNILGKLQLNLDIHIAVDIMPVGTTGDPFANQFVDVAIYSGCTCEEVLKQILYKCRLIQRENGWYVESYNNLARDSYVLYNYNSLGNTLSVATTEVIGETSIDYENIEVSGAHYERLAALNKVVVTQDFQKKENIITNGDFEDEDGIGSSDGWSVAGTTADIRKDENDDSFIYLQSGKQDVDAENLSHYITQLIGSFQKTVDNHLKLTFSYALMGTSGHSAPLYCRLLLRGNSGVNYYAEYNINYDGEITLVFSSTPDTTVMRLNASVNDDETGLDYSDIDAYPYNEIGSGWRSFSLPIEGLPESGSLQFYLFVAKTSDNRIANSCIKSANLVFQDADDGDLSAEIAVTGYNAKEYIENKDDIKLMQGSLPNYPNSNVIYKGGVLKSASVSDISTLWTIAGLGLSYTYSELMTRLVLSQRETPSLIFDGTLSGGDINAGLRLIDERSSTTKLICAGVTWNVYDNEWEGKWIQVRLFNAGGICSSSERVTNDSATSVRSSGDSLTRVFSSGSSGTPVRITDLSSLAALTDDYFFEVDKAGAVESKKISAAKVIACLNTFLSQSSSDVKSGIITNVSGYNISVTFHDALPDTEVIIPSLKVYRYREYKGIYAKEEVIYYFKTINWYNYSGFSLSIDSSENLSGVIIEYQFRIKNSIGDTIINS